MADGYQDGDSPWDEDNEDEDDDHKEHPEALKDKLIFLIDAQEDMLSLLEVGDSRRSSFEMARDAVVELLKLKAVQQPDDQIAVLLYNTAARDQPGQSGAGSVGALVASFEGVRTLLELQQPSAEAVRTVRDLTVGSFRRDIGSAPVRRDGSLSDALFRVQNILATSRTAENSLNTLVVFTNDAEPCGSGPGMRSAIAQLAGRVEVLQGYRVALRVFPLAALERPFDSGRLWRALLRALRGREAGDGETDPAAGLGGDWVGEDDIMLQSLAADPARRGDPLSVIMSLFDAFKRRLARKRTALRTWWHLSEGESGLKLAVRGYTLISDESKVAKRTVPLNPITNQPLKTVTTYVSPVDGRLLEREEVTRLKAFRLTSGDKGRVPEVLVPSSLISSSGPGALAPPGLVLLGFKPLAALAPYHTLRAPTFLRPDEVVGPGSTATFIALWRAMLAEGRFALCRYRRGNSCPRLVALVAADESVNMYGMQTDPPGIHMIYLPYSDDVRHPETATGLVPLPPTSEQLSAASALVASLPLDSAEPFDLTHISNPWLQRHYGMVEALALSEQVPTWCATRDDTLPKKELFETEAAVSAREAFRAAFPQSAPVARGTKRRAEGEAGAGAGVVRGSKASRAEGVAEAYDAIDWVAKLRGGQLSRLTKEDLAVYLKRHQLKVSGKKDELVQRVTEHLQQQMGEGS